MLSCPRCGTGNLKEGWSLSMHLTRYCMGPSVLFHAQKGTFAKKHSHELMLSGSCPSTYQQQIRNLNSLVVNWLYPFHLQQGHSTQLQMRRHIHVSLCKQCPKAFWNIFIISIHGLVYFHQNTKQFFVEFVETNNAITLKQHQQFFLECIVLIIVDDVNVKVISITWISFIQWCEGWFRVLFFTTEFLVYVDGFKQISHNTVMRERVLDIVLLNDVSLEFTISTLTASQNINCPYLVGFWQIFTSSIQLKPSWKDFDDWKEVASTSILCDFAHHGIE